MDEIENITQAAVSPEIASDKLKRIFVFYSCKINNGDCFLAALYGQGVADELFIQSATELQIFCTDEALQNRIIRSSTCNRGQLGQELCCSTHCTLEMESLE